ncbi:uncharacterized protein BDR25DRAFT_304139 [Lindgomyces ingoldianus]|uniref:Uncharacterized protein n=1 Tax=Lindgomyces ingoldianus TaxID=673940 RepID=A0ACB6QT64_9PLEO|nr:uncharacterized protein BDR25DRAFT_304139 [Lindgomyces ingoldianus]KAF2470199.1 hypothetical protein BDR25DRAFT_304139 [Lindgomyces ingoldianus]
MCWGYALLSGCHSIKMLVMVLLVVLPGTRHSQLQENNVQGARHNDSNVLVS